MMLSFFIWSLVFLFPEPDPVEAFSQMTTIASMWGSNDTDEWIVTPGSFSVCILQASTLEPRCFGTPAFTNGTSPPTRPLIGLSAGSHFTCGLDYGSRFPVCWGQLQVPERYQNTSYTSISSGAFHVCALRADETRGVDCWGDAPVGVPVLGLGSLASGWGFSCGLTEEGSAVCWGKLARDVPQPLNVRYSSVFAGGNTVCGVSTGSKSLRCWGTDDHGQSLAPSGFRFSAVTGGLHHTCGIRSDNHHAFCWGSDEYSQLRAPKDVPFSMISAGDFYTCGVRLDERNRVLCWGNSVDRVASLNASAHQALCVSQCGRGQFLDRSGSCPALNDKVCLECSECTGGAVELSACGPDEDRVCGASKKRAQAFLVPHALIPVAGLLFLGCLVMGAWIFVQWRRQRERKKVVRKLEVLASRNENDRVVPISAADLQAATGNYSEEMVLGKGSFGIVYKGVLQDGREVAIKRATSSRSCEFFDKELQLLSRTHHSCLVNLVGYSLEEKLLVFEFMSRGSLFQHITEPSSELGWVTRIKIAAQSARGLEYLHKYACPTIIHRDVKTANILLDKDWNAHVADFGLSLFGPPGSATHLSNMTIVGTPGYLDPEYGLTMKLTTKSDVYSFGVVLLELLSGEKPLDPFRPVQSISAWAKGLVEQDDRGRSVLDPTLSLPPDSEPLLACLSLALECTRTSSRERPTMTDAAKRLEEILERMMEGC